MYRKPNCLPSIVLMIALTGSLAAQGTLAGGAAIVDGSLVISAQDQWMEMPGDIIDMQTLNEVTIEAWYTPAEGINTGFTMLAYFGDTVNGFGANGYFFTSARGDNKSRAAISIGVEVNPWTGESGADGPEYDDGVMHHMVSTLTNDEITLYIDGELCGATPMATTNGIWGISPNYAYLSKSGYDADPEWIGEIHEFNIYNTALSAEEVLFLALQYPSTAVDENEISTLPKEYGLSQNYPNPFNPTTNISFDLPIKSKVSIQVYDVLGREVARLVDGVKPAGRHNIQFNGMNLSSGMYICRMGIDTQIFTKKMMLLK